MEERMEERNNIWASVAVAALIGGVITALLYTDRGRRSVLHLERALDDFGRTLQHLRVTIRKAGMVAAEGIEVASEGMETVSQLISNLGEQRRDASVLH
jgi:hypothetical protein